MRARGTRAAWLGFAAGLLWWCPAGASEPEPEPKPEPPAEVAPAFVPEVVFESRAGADAIWGVPDDRVWLLDYKTVREHPIGDPSPSRRWTLPVDAEWLRGVETSEGVVLFVASESGDVLRSTTALAGWETVRAAGGEAVGLAVQPGAVTLGLVDGVVRWSIAADGSVGPAVSHRAPPGWPEIAAVVAGGSVGGVPRTFVVTEDLGVAVLVGDQLGALQPGSAWDGSDVGGWYSQATDKLFVVNFFDGRRFDVSTGEFDYGADFDSGELLAGIERDGPALVLSRGETRLAGAESIPLASGSFDDAWIDRARGEVHLVNTFEWRTVTLPSATGEPSSRMLGDPSPPPPGAARYRDDLDIAVPQLTTHFGLSVHPERTQVALGFYFDVEAGAHLTFDSYFALRPVVGYALDTAPGRGVHAVKAGLGIGGGDIVHGFVVPRFVYVGGRGPGFNVGLRVDVLYGLGAIEATYQYVHNLRAATPEHAVIVMLGLDPAVAVYGLHKFAEGLRRL